MTERWRPIAAWSLFAIVALLPFGAAPEVPLLFAAGIGVVASLRGAIDWHTPAARLALLLFAGYWLPELLSAFDAVAPRKAWTEVAADLRFLPLLAAALYAFDSAERWRRMPLAIALLLALWCVDALVQAATGWSLGGPAGSDRLSGIFGDDNLKLGGVVAVLAPFALVVAWQRGGWRLALLVFVPLLAVLLLAGARAAWAGFALALALLLWQRLGLMRGSVALLLSGVLTLGIAALGYAASDRFAERVDRTAAALAGDEASVDHALAHRLPIWRTAWAMGAAHPVNGVGVRGFRHAYPQFAGEEDPWVGPDRSQGALHAHQLLLELWSETGLLGLACWTLALYAASRAWRQASREQRERALAPSLALVTMLFPVNTHYAVYSNFWSLLLFAMLALWLGALQARGEHA